MNKYIEDLYEYIHQEDQDSLINKLAELFGIEQDQSMKIVDHLDFADWIEVTNAVNSGDKDKVEYIVGSKIAPTMKTEGSNSYSSSSSSFSTATTDVPDIKAGDKAGLTMPDGKTIEVDVEGEPDDSFTKVKDSSGKEQVVPKGSLSELPEEIQRLKQLAGISEEEVEEGVLATGKVTSMTPSFLGSAAISGAVMSPRKQERLTRTKKEMKPGPDKGAKYKKSKPTGIFK